MSGGFSFHFGGDDIEGPDETEAEDKLQIDATNDEAKCDASEALLPQVHSIQELLDSLPDQIGYATTTITSPSGKSICLPRRELWDIKMQLMAEDDGTKPDLLAGLEDTDVRTNIYEGGFKTWECSLDLVKYLLDQKWDEAPGDMPEHIIELGAGTALPTLTLFRTLLCTPFSDKSDARPVKFTITDYNPTVLTHSTLPNLLLTYITTLTSSSDLFSDGLNPLASGSSLQPTSSITLSPGLLSSFVDMLNARRIHLTLVSGTWSPSAPFIELMHGGSPFSADIIPQPGPRSLILASETIYSPSAVRSFSELLEALLKSRKGTRALVAAKQVYFGVGGGVDAFVQECHGRDLEVEVLSLKGLEGAGVRRCILSMK